jgi:fluoride exporter
VSGPALWGAVAAVGAVGALARLHIGALVTARAGMGFPWGTLVVNLIAAFGAGLAYGSGLDGAARSVAAIAAMGSLSTFSTWMLDTMRLAETGRRCAAAANLAVPLVAGAAVAAVGWALGAAL